VAPSIGLDPGAETEVEAEARRLQTLRLLAPDVHHLEQLVLPLLDLDDADLAQAITVRVKEKVPRTPV